jgi:hypothetical protein
MPHRRSDQIPERNPQNHLKLGARYYNPTTAQFTQPDPAALYGGYAYAADNPANFTDPTGRDVHFTLTPRDLGAIGIAIAAGAGTATAIAAYTGNEGAALAIGLIGIVVGTGFGLLANYGCSVNVSINTAWSVPYGGSANLSGCSRQP